MQFNFDRQKSIRPLHFRRESRQTNKGTLKSTTSTQMGIIRIYRIGAFVCRVGKNDDRPIDINQMGVWGSVGNMSRGSVRRYGLRLKFWGLAACCEFPFCCAPATGIHCIVNFCHRAFSRSSSRRLRRPPETHLFAANNLRFVRGRKLQPIGIPLI